jgi:FMN-dependent NADH-azoreductase
MKTLLVINSSGRVTRSITRRLTRRFSDRWSSHPEHRVVERDLTASAPSVVNEAWITAAFRDPAEHTAADREALRQSDALIDELIAADAVIFGVPLYNFGMPAQLKAYIDQLVRVGRTFALDPTAAIPYWGLLSPKPVVVVTSAGDGALLKGGELEHLNFLEPHLTHVLSFIGLGDPTWIRVGYEEFGDDRLKRALATAEASLDSLADNIAAPDQLAASA